MRHSHLFKGTTNPLIYALSAPALLLVQHAGVGVVYGASGIPMAYDLEFWLLPLRHLAGLPGLPAWAAGLAFATSIAIAWGLAVLSFRRASWSGGGYILAALSVIPVIQIGAVMILGCLPRLKSGEVSQPEPGINTLHVLQGVLAGVGIIVGAVLVSAVMFGAYGWGLFVVTPFMVGLATAYLSNRQRAISGKQTMALVMASAALGTVALIAFALEGIVCVLLAAPLGALVAALGSVIGREAALAAKRRDKPLMSIAFLPVLFALETIMPPAVPIESHESIDIAASPEMVWHALTSRDVIAASPGLVATAGFAYPIRSHITGEGIAAVRQGYFSTGTSREKVTAWVPGQRLAFTVLSQPPMMEEMSPYRKVHAPHVSGYFYTSKTGFDIKPLANGMTRLTVTSTHMLHIDPVLYWQPMAKWAIRENVSRVLLDIKIKSEAPAKSARTGYDMAK
jgi:hypothetical protein